MILSVLNGSSKGEYSITLQTVRYLEKLHGTTHKKLTLICGDYFQTDFGRGCFDCAVSFETMHHFPPEKKTELYRRVWDSLRDGGCYIECDYMAETQQQQDFFFAENERLRREAGAVEGEYFHYDTPCTAENQIRMLRDAGFSHVEQIFRIGRTVMLAAEKCRRH